MSLLTQLWLGGFLFFFFVVVGNLGCISMWSCPVLCGYKFQVELPAVGMVPQEQWTDVQHKNEGYEF